MCVCVDGLYVWMDYVMCVDGLCVWMDCVCGWIVCVFGWIVRVWERERERDVKIGKGWSWWLMPVIPALWEAKVSRSLEVKSLRSAWPTWWNPVSIKNTKISQAWWHMPVIPATWKAEAGELLELKRQRLQWAEIVPLHSVMWQSETLSQSKKKM